MLRDAARLDRTQSDPLVALRNAVGIAAPLLIGAIVGSASLGLAATTGALQTSFADRPGPYRLRLLRMLGVAVAAGVTSALAVAASRNDVLSVLLLAALGLGAGLLLTAGQSAAQVGTASTAAALVLGHLPQASSAALHVGLLVAAGGAGQAVLAVAAWPLRRHRPERTALAALFRELATAARAQADATIEPPAAAALGAARSTFYGVGHDHGRSLEAYRVLLDEADRIRRELLTITSLAERLAARNSPILAGLVRGALTAAGSVLDDTATALSAGRAVSEDVQQRARATIGHTVERLRENPDDASSGLTRRATASRLGALGGQLRAVVQTTRTGASEGAGGERFESASGRLLHDPFATIRANLTPDSAVLRHAVRLAFVLAASDAVVRAADLGRGYWVSLTLLVVLRPDFGQTLQRSVMRVVGTVAGLLLATALVHYVPGGDWWNVALIAVFAFGVRLAGPGNVALTAVNLSALIVVLLEIQGVAARETFVDRSVSTLVGGALAIAAVLAFPTWERQFVAGRLGDLLIAYRDYFDVVTDAGADPAPEVVDRARLVAARAECRVARTNAQASLDRLAAEPVPARGQVELGRAVLAHSHRLIHAILTLDAVRRPLRRAGGLPLLAGFAGPASETMAALATAVATGTPPATLPRLRPRLQELTERLVDDPDLVGGSDTAIAVIEAGDRITNSLDTLAAELRRQLLDPATILAMREPLRSPGADPR